MHFIKAQASISNILMYIMAVLIVSFILIFGYKAINGFGKNIEDVSEIKFKQDFTSAVNRISFDYGSRVEETFSVPNYREICIVSSYPTYADTVLNSGYLSMIDDYPIIQDYIKSIVEEKANPRNVFLVDTITEDSFDIGPVIVDKGLLCINVKEGRLKLIIEGLGNHAKISKAE